MMSSSAFSRRPLKSSSWSAWPQKSPPTAAWMNGSCQGAASKPPIRNLHYSFQKFTMNSPSHGAPPTQPTSTLLPPSSSSPPLMEPSKRTMRSSLLSKRPSLRSSACPQLWDGKPRLGVVQTSVRDNRTHVLHSEMQGAIEMVLPEKSESSFYSHYFFIPKKDGGLRPILDLRLLNRALMKWPFWMLTLKQILTQICPEDWFLSLDLKDTFISREPLITDRS